MRKFLLLTLLLLGSMAGFSQTLMPIPAHSSVYTGGTRGYWFTSPTCFTITQLRVPTEASTAAQNVAVVRFAATPPFYSTVTNNFTILALYQNVNTTTPIPVNIQIQQGDIIGILGTRGTANSYASAPYTSNIGGTPVTLTRLGFQTSLSTVPPADLFQEPGGSLSRVEMFYNLGLTHNVSTSIVGNTVDFTLSTDTSIAVSWDFGDGNTSTTHNPTHTYAPGIYNACAYINTTCGVDTVCVPITLCVPPTTAFTPSTTGLTASFVNNTTGGTSYFWDFGDGTTDTSATPAPHTYSTTGTYNVCLVSTSSCGATDTVCTTVTACVAPTGAFTLNQMGRDSISFTNGSTQGQSYFWDFGDGNTDTLANPMHIYTASGTYTVCMVTQNLCGSDTVCQTVNICLNAPFANFTSSVSTVNASFTDASAFGTGWMWDFGDGNTSTLQNPTHTYTQNGSFNVCLILTNDCGESDTTCQTISICAPPVAGFTYTANLGQITFVDGSSFATNWSWTFGDGGVSTAQSPIHTYSVGGTYQVCMVVTSACGADSICDSINVVLVGMEEAMAGMDVKVYPNPAQSYATVLVSGISASSFELELFDLAGAKVRVANGKTEQPLTIDVNGLADGMYLYHILVDGQMEYSGKLTVE